MSSNTIVYIIVMHVPGPTPFTKNTIVYIIVMHVPGPTPFTAGEQRD